LQPRDYSKIFHKISATKCIDWMGSMGLNIYLLGQFKLQADNQLIELASRPAQSLLAYLALNAGVIQRREKLASLLWPEATETNARSYLRQALWRIRKSLESGSLSGEDFLQISDISVTFNNQADYWLDAQILLETTEIQSREELIKGLRLYQGELLPGFYDEWVIRQRDRIENTYHQKMNMLLEQMIQAEQWDDTLKWGEEWIRLGYSPEAAFRALMMAHAELGDLGMVNSTYLRCVDSLNQQLDIEPSPETQMLYERLRASEQQDVLSTAPQSAAYAVNRPAFLEADELQPIEKAIFVSRECELGQMDAQLRLALSGKGRVIFITGEAGSGKTMLIQKFTQRAQSKYPDLIVAGGNCNAQTGIGDPYLPFRQILELLTGDVEARWAAGAISGEHARLLWNSLPITVKGLIESGPDLVETFVSGQPLLDRAAAATPQNTDWLPRLKDIVDRQRTTSMIPAPQQSDLFEQYARVLGTLSLQIPLMLVVDDLQWADTGSVGLLFHLGRHLAGSRILIVGAYRPEEVALGRDGNRHPLDPVVNEFQRQFGEITVDLSQAESRDFVESLLDSELNHLGPSFRQMLFQQTRGHPLFTVELMRGMQERGDVVKDQEGQWIESAALDWETLPARVEAVIAERTKRLPQPLGAALRVASVEGEEFSAEVIAKVLGTDEREMVQRLSSELDRRHRLIRARAIERLGSQRFSRYRFQHYLCQKYMYDNLDPVERSYLHEDVGNALEALYRGQEQETAAIAPQLARHFQEAGITEKAIHYLHQAGEKAVQLSAYQEGITHLKRGLALLKTLPESPERDELELALQLSFGKAVTGIPIPEWKNAYTRARELCLQMGDTSQLCRILGELSIFHYMRAEYHRARELEEEALSLAQQSGDLLMVAISHWYLGFVSFALGEFTTALDHIELMIAFYKPLDHHQSMVVLRGSDAGTSALSFAACCLWCLGYPEQALQRSQEALILARDHGHPFSLCDVVCYAGCRFNAMRRDAPALKQHAEQMVRIATENHFQAWMGTANMSHGEALILLGQVQEGETQLRAGMDYHLSIGDRCYLSEPYGFLAEGQVKAGQLEQAMTTLNEVLTLVNEIDERYWEAELYRLRGEIILSQGDEAEAEANLYKAIQVARQQKARSWELRAATDLARLWGSQGKTEEAHALLAPVYEWFTEGFDTPDLISARTLLEQLS
jgi:predicted ATPase/DNA-binding SARP family transcriptional activator/predicted negative regulator of RcsB-dependent stress response